MVSNTVDARSRRYELQARFYYLTFITIPFSTGMPLPSTESQNSIPEEVGVTRHVAAAVAALACLFSAALTPMAAAVAKDDFTIDLRLGFGFPASLDV